MNHSVCLKVTYFNCKYMDVVLIPLNVFESALTQPLCTKLPRIFLPFIDILLSLLTLYTVCIVLLLPQTHAAWRSATQAPPLRSHLPESISRCLTFSLGTAWAICSSLIDYGNLNIVSVILNACFFVDEMRR